jgi:hypothetical protein
MITKTFLHGAQMTALDDEDDAELSNLADPHITYHIHPREGLHLGQSEPLGMQIAVDGTIVQLNGDGGAAERAGIQAGTQVVRVGHVGIADSHLGVLEQIKAVLGDLTPGQPLQLVVRDRIQSEPTAVEVEDRRLRMSTAPEPDRPDSPSRTFPWNPTFTWGHPALDVIVEEIWGASIDPEFDKRKVDNRIIMTGYNQVYNMCTQKCVHSLNLLSGWSRASDMSRVYIAGRRTTCRRSCT